jgi:Fe-S-cluster containining protein
MRRDRFVLRVGYAASVGLAAAAFLIGLGWVTSVGVLLGFAFAARAGIYLYYERFLAFKYSDDFVSGKVRHECIACGASCHLKVNLGKDDVERILKHAKETGMTESVIEKSGDNYWLKRRPTGACIFLTYEGNLPRCSIYSIRPTACRLYPLIPSGNRLKVDPLCPALSKVRGHTFKEHLITQGVLTHVRKVMGKI